MSLIKNWFSLSFSNLVQQVLNFLIVIKLTKVLTPNEFGLYSFFLTIIYISITLSGLGVKQIIIREISRDNNISKKIFISFLFLYFLTSFFSIIIVIFYLYNFEGIKNSALYVIFFLTFIVLHISILLETLFFGYQNIHPISLISLFAAITNFIIIILLPEANTKNIIILISIFSLSNSIKTILMLFLAKKNNYINFKFLEFNVNLIKKIVYQSLPLFGVGILTLPSNQLPILLLGTFSSKSEVGFYSLSSKLLGPMYIIYQNLYNVIYPKFSEQYSNNLEAFNKNIKDAFNLFFFVGFPLIATFSIFSQNIISIFFRDIFLHTHKIFSIQILTFFNFMLHSFIGYILTSANKEKVVFYLSIINSLIVLLFSFLTVKNGAFGISMGIYFAYFLSLIIHFIVLYKQNIILSEIKNLYVVFSMYVFVFLCVLTNILNLFIVKLLAIFIIIVISFKILINYANYFEKLKILLPKYISKKM